MEATCVPATMWREMFKQMASRNEVIEIAPIAHQNRGQGTTLHGVQIQDTIKGANEAISSPPSTTVRLLEASEKRLVIQEPTLPAACRDGTHVQLTACWKGSRWVARTTVQRSLEFPLQNQRMMRALALDVPAECIDAQRREFFRVNVHGLGFESVILYPKRDGTRMPDEMPLPCVMLNISAGGLGLVAATTEALGSFRDYECQFKVPGDAQPFVFDCEIVNTTQREGNTSFVGVRFIIGDDAAGCRLKDQLHKIIVELQRRQRQMSQLRPCNRNT